MIPNQVACDDTSFVFLRLIIASERRLEAGLSVGREVVRIERRLWCGAASGSSGIRIVFRREPDIPHCIRIGLAQESDS